MTKVHVHFLHIFSVDIAASPPTVLCSTPHLLSSAAPPPTVLCSIPTYCPLHHPHLLPSAPSPPTVIALVLISSAFSVYILWAIS